MDPITLKILAKIAVVIFGLNEVSKEISSEKSRVEIKNDEIQKLRDNELRNLSSSLDAKSKKQKLDYLYEQKKKFVEISNKYFQEKQRLYSKIQTSYDQIREINTLKQQLFAAGHHDSVRDLKIKTDELHSLCKSVQKQFDEFEIKVKGYNKLVSDMKLEIEKLKS
jgi:tRNA pseudouridine-54 N-methylase